MQILQSEAMLICYKFPSTTSNLYNWTSIKNKYMYASYRPFLWNQGPDYMPEYIYLYTA